MTTRAESQSLFYKEFLMTRGRFSPADFGVSVGREELTDQMIEEFHGVYRDGWTIDELLLHPREASRFCDDTRRKFGYWDLPDDIILRVVLNARKNP